MSSNHTDEIVPVPPEEATPPTSRPFLKVIGGILASALFTLIFWLIWGFLTRQETPMTEVIRRWPRWWDTAIIPIWVIIGYLTLRHRDFHTTGPYCPGLMWLGGISGSLCAILTALLTLRFTFAVSFTAGAIAVAAISTITILALVLTGQERTGQAKVILREWIIGCWLGTGSTLCVIFGSPLSIPVIAITLAALVVYFILG